MGFPAQLTTGESVYIVKKELEGGGSEVELFTDADGRVYTRHPSGGLVPKASSDETPAVEPDAEEPTTEETEDETTEVETTETPEAPPRGRRRPPTPRLTTEKVEAAAAEAAALDAETGGTKAAQAGLAAIAEGSLPVYGPQAADEAPQTTETE